MEIPPQGLSGRCAPEGRAQSPPRKNPLIAGGGVVPFPSGKWWQKNLPKEAWLGLRKDFALSGDGFAAVLWQLWETQLREGGAVDSPALEPRIPQGQLEKGDLEIAKQ